VRTFQLPKLYPRLNLALIGALVVLSPPLQAQEGVFLTEGDAPKAVFPDADTFERHVIVATPELRDRLRVLLRNVEPSIWEAVRSPSQVGPPRPGTARSHVSSKP